MKHEIEIDLHEAKKSIDEICILGAMIKDKDAKKHLSNLDTYLQSIWDKILVKQNQYNSYQKEASQ